MSPGRESFGSMSLHLGGDAYIRCATYSNGTVPILTIDIPHHGLSLSPAGHKGPLTAQDVAKARELADAVAVYVAEVERLHAEQPAADAEAA